MPAQERGPLTHSEEIAKSSGSSATEGAAALREADVKDEIASIDRGRSKVVVGWTVLLVIAGVTLFQAPAQYAVLPLLPFLTFKRAMLRYEHLGSRKQTLLAGLDEERRLRR